MTTFKANLELATEISFRRSGEPMVVNVDSIPANILVELVYHGLIQKIGDAAAGKSGLEAAEAMVAVRDRLYNGEWTGRRESVTDPLASVRKFIRTIMRTAAKDNAEFKAAENKNEWLDAKFAAQSDEVRAKIVAKAEKMAAEIKAAVDIEL